MAMAQMQLPAGVYAGQLDAGLAPAGDYRLDPDHTAVVAKVSHIGYSYSIFRFGKVTGNLHWDADPVKDTLEATVETASIETPVAGFAAELAGPGYLDSKKYPEARFVSTKFVKVGATEAKVAGNFTLLGKTVPLTFDVMLVGAGKGFMGHARMGAEATANLKTADFGLSPMLGEQVQLVIDAEFGSVK